MEKLTVSLSILILYILLMLVVIINSGGIVNPVNGQEEEKTWCVAKPSSSDAELTANINFACDNLKDCRLIQPNGACYNPNTNINHASVVMNLYYQSNGRNSWNCDFKDSGLISKNDPSYGDCHYP